MRKSLLLHGPITLWLVVFLLVFAVGCGEDDEASNPNLANPPVGTRPDTLAEWDLFSDTVAQTPKEDVVPYEVTSPLFTDFAAKKRFLYVPPKKSISYEETDNWTFPSGTVLVKTFSYPIDERSPELGERLIETRLLIHEGSSGWRPLVYRWNDEQTEATRITGGATVAVSYINADGETVDIPNYGIPANGLCRDCHGPAPDTLPIGPKTPMLHLDNDYGEGLVNQVDHLHGLGLFDRAPDAIGSRLAFPDPESDDIAISDTDKARSYLDSNCAHCHSPWGEVSFKNLFLDWQSTDPQTGDPAHWGVCKQPTSAGNGEECEQFYNIEPGLPADSLLACRVETVGPGLMPEVGRTQSHEAGVAVIEAWIAEMNLPACNI